MKTSKTQHHLQADQSMKILITSVTLTGVSDPDGTVRFGPQDSEDEGGFFALVEEFYAVIFTSTFLIGTVVLLAGWMFARIDTPLSYR